MTFRLTISDVGVFLGKSPVTLRSWERKGLLTMPRVGGKRVLSVKDVLAVAEIAYRHHRITNERWFLIREALMVLSLIETENTV